MSRCSVASEAASCLLAGFSWHLQATADLGFCFFCLVQLVYPARSPARHHELVFQGQRGILAYIQKLHNLRYAFAKFGGGNFQPRIESAVMQALLTAPRPVQLLPQPMKPLKVVVAYDGIEAGQHAIKIYSHLMHEIAIDLQCENTLMSFNLLANPAFANEAEEKASEADMLIVAANEAMSPPPAVKRWIKRWLLTRTPDEAALVGITRARLGVSPPEHPLHDYLKNTAEESGIPYFQGVFPVSSGSVSPFESLEDHAQKMPPPLDGRPGDSEEHARWGLNE
jgi:hypothetical protein